MPNSAQIKQFLVGVVIPPIAGAVATWLVVHVHFLALFHLPAGSVAQSVASVLVFAVSAGLAWLTGHHILRGSYTPAAVKARGLTPGG